MFNSKQNRIADLEARLRVALKKREPIDDGTAATIRALRQELAATKTQLDNSQEQVAVLIARLGEYADTAITNGQCAARNKAAWKSARLCAEAYGEGILRHVEEREQWHKWFDQEQASHEEHRRNLAILLNLPPHADWLKVTRRMTQIVAERDPEATP
jgi:uncharacterized coiled-coil protein SlyX